MANASVFNSADSDGSAGNDSITTGSGNDTLAGGAWALGVSGASAIVTNLAFADGTAGGDVINSGDGNDDVAGDAWAKADSGLIKASVINDAAMGGSAGDDEINTGAGSDRISGEATDGGEGAEAKVFYDAHWINSSGASAGKIGRAAWRESVCQEE